MVFNYVSGILFRMPQVLIKATHSMLYVLDILSIHWVCLSHLPNYCCILLSAYNMPIETPSSLLRECHYSFIVINKTRFQKHTHL